MVLYCGHETKMNLNQGRHRSKQSHIEKLLDYLLIGNIIMMLILDLALSLKLYTSIQKYGDGMWYIYPDGKDSILYFVRALGTYFTIFNQMIPLALVITIEIAKIVLSRVMENDIQMINAKDLT